MAQLASKSKSADLTTEGSRFDSYPRSGQRQAEYNHEKTRSKPNVAANNLVVDAT